MYTYVYGYMCEQLAAAPSLRHARHALCLLCSGTVGARSGLGFGALARCALLDVNPALFRGLFTPLHLRVPHDVVEPGLDHEELHTRPYDEAGWHNAQERRAEG